MQGTIVNVISIIIGSLIGHLIGKRLNPKYSESSLQILGIIAISLGITWSVNNISRSETPLLFICSLVIGNLIGTSIGIEERIQNFSCKIQKNSSSSLVQGLTTTVLLFCLGTFSILGSINAALYQEYTLLYTNALLDGITCIVFASTYGFGIALSAIFLFIWQGSIYYSAHLVSPYITEPVLIELSIIGGILILITGLNILKITNIKILNILPSLIISVLYRIIVK